MHSCPRHPLAQGMIGASLALVLSLFTAMGATAQPLSIPQFEAGKHYEVLGNPAKVAADNKIEVMEIFWYGCGHCYRFEPYVNNWKKTKADDIEFLRTPAVWRKQMKSHAALYYVVEQMGLPAAIHNDLFLLLTKESSLDDEKRFASVFAKYGVAEEDFLKSFHSFSVKAKVKQGENRVRKNYKVGGTPEVVVNGKYRVTLTGAGGPDQLFEVVDYLIEQERSVVN